MVLLQDEAVAIPICCIASSHSLDFDYQWEGVSGKMLGSTPVMWINKLGTYRCTVTNPGINRECHSTVITVEMVSGMWLQMVVSFLHKQIVILVL